MRRHTVRLDSVPLTPEFLAAQDCVVVITDHTRFDFDLVSRHSRLVVDTRNATARCKAPRCRIVKA
jgi:UDP-N-acetyl-D-glucosamine dehydrogenase